MRQRLRLRRTDVIPRTRLVAGFAESTRPIALRIVVVHFLAGRPRRESRVAGAAIHRGTARYRGLIGNVVSGLPQRSAQGKLFALVCAVVACSAQRAGDRRMIHRAGRPVCVSRIGVTQVALRRSRNMRRALGLRVLRDESAAVARCARRRRNE